MQRNVRPRLRIVPAFAQGIGIAADGGFSTIRLLLFIPGDFLFPRNVFGAGGHQACGARRSVSSWCIEDPELRRAIRGLRVGDCVYLTIKTAQAEFHGETVLVCITRIRERDYLGKLAHSPASLARARQAGTRIAFNAAHMHSLQKGEPADD